MRLLSGIEAIGSNAVKIFLVCTAAVTFLIIGLLVAPSFTNGLIRGHTERELNQKLVGYHTTAGHARLNLLDGDLALIKVLVAQNAHPNPPVMDIGSITAYVEWRALFTGCCF